MKEIFEWDRILMNNLPYSFLLEVVFRSALMYIITLVTIKIAGRRGVQQLSIFELVIIISLGSAAGDPSLYEDVGLLPAITVFIVILSLYRLTTYFISKDDKIESLLEGDPIYLIENGEFAVDKFDKEDMAQDEFFAELRLKNVEHLGQVRLAILETNGQISLFYYLDEDVKHGLPITPKEFNNRDIELQRGKHYACYFCANVQIAHKANDKMNCKKCGKEGWVLACNHIRLN